MTSTTRKLAAIMFTDIVGYTSLMDSDEDRAFEIVRNNRRIHWRLIKKYRGKFLKEMGDGILASFPSNTDAALCALSIQQTARQLNIPLRIGIHMGEVIREKKDILGHGVNVASRVQGMAETNEIAISEIVYHDIKNKKGILFTCYGEHLLKGVKNPVTIYGIDAEKDGELDFTFDTGELIKPIDIIKKTMVVGVLLAMIVFTLIYFFFSPINNSSKKAKYSLAVFPILNISADSTNDYFSQGLTEGMITTLANIKQLSIRSSDAVIKLGDTISANLKGKLLDVDYILEGKANKQPHVASILFTLRDVKKDTYIWGNTYEKGLNELTELPGVVTNDIVRTLGLQIPTTEKERIEQRISKNYTAYDYYLRAVHEDRNWSVDGSYKTIEYLEKAIELDPEFSEAYSLYAWQWVQLSVSYPVISTKEALNKALPAAQMAIKYDSLSSDAYIILAAIYHNLKWDFEKAEVSFMKSLEINDWGEAPIYQCYCIIVEYFVTMHRLQEANDIIRKTVDNKTANFSEYSYLGIMQLGQGNYEEAARLVEKQIHYITPSWLIYSLLGIMYHYAGEFETAIQKLEIGFDMTDKRPGKLLSRLAMAYYQMEQNEKAFEILGELLDRHKQGEYGLAYPIALIYNEMGDEENTFKWLNIHYENREAYLLYIGYIDFPNLRNHPRFIDLLNKIGFDV